MIETEFKGLKNFVFITPKIPNDVLLKELAKKRPDFFEWKDSQGNLAESALTRNIDATLKQEKEKTAKKH